MAKSFSQQLKINEYSFSEPDTAKRIELHQLYIDSLQQIHQLENQLADSTKVQFIPDKYLLHENTPVDDQIALCLSYFEESRAKFPVPSFSRIGENDGQVHPSAIFMLDHQRSCYDGASSAESDVDILKSISNSEETDSFFLPDEYQNLVSLRQRIIQALDVIFDIIGSYHRKTSFVFDSYEASASGSLCQLWHIKNGRACAPSFLNKTSMSFGVAFQFCEVDSVSL